MVAAIEKKSFRDFDWVLTFLAIAILGFGIVQIHNAQPGDDKFWQKQLVGAIISFIVMLGIALTDYRRLIDAAPFLYVFGLFLLMIVLIPGIGLRLNGQRCWIQVPLLGQFQPSEFVKIPVVLMLARYYGSRKAGVLRWSEIFVGIGILAAPIALILLEPDAGQAITYFPLLGVILFLSSIKIRWVLIAILLVVIGTPLAYSVGKTVGFVKPYHQARIEAILDPEKADPKGFGYNTVQSIITVGKGGLTGSQGDEFSQSALKFLPEPHSDFIFAVTAENTGFVGCISLLFAYLLFLSRFVAGARDATDRHGVLVIMAFAGGLMFQIFMNVGMVVGILPVIGVPLPLMSAGSSAVLSTFIAIGFVISVKMRRFVNG